MMRHALSLKFQPSNANPNAANSNVNLKNAPAPPVGKLTRQIGSSNLRSEIVLVEHVKVNEPVIKTDVKENFEVYEDPEEEKTTNNSLIRVMEQKMEEKILDDEMLEKDIDERSQFLLIRNNSETMSIMSEPPSEVSAVYDNDDDDKVSIASSTFTNVRASLSAIHFDAKLRDEEAAKRAETMRKRSEKRERDNFMFNSEEYFKDILEYMRSREMKLRAASTYMKHQKEINEDMRAILIDWFHDVVKEYGLEKETFHLAVSVVDRVMSFLSVDKIQFQLVGTTSLMIASKYEEIFPPEIKEFAMITDNTYRVNDILRMERYLLGSLNFVIAAPTAVWFANAFTKRMFFSERMSRTVDYLIDLSLLDCDFLDYPPSLIAAASCCFSNVQHEMEEAWPSKMVEDTGIRTQDFEDVLRDLHRLFICASTSENKSIYNKYCERGQYEAALAPAPTKKLRELFPRFFGPKNSPMKNQKPNDLVLL